MNEPIDTDELRAASNRLTAATAAYDEFASPPDLEAKAEWLTAIGMLRYRVIEFLANGGAGRAALSASPAGERDDDRHEREMCEVIAERDRAEEWADKLSWAIAPIEVIGEHSNLNNPWQNALDAAPLAAGERDTTEAGEVQHLYRVSMAAGLEAACGFKPIGDRPDLPKCPACLAARPAPVTGKGELDEVWPDAGPPTARCDTCNRPTWTPLYQGPCDRLTHRGRCEGSMVPPDVTPAGLGGEPTSPRAALSASPAGEREPLALSLADRAAGFLCGPHEAHWREVGIDPTAVAELIRELNLAALAAGERDTTEAGEGCRSLSDDCDDFVHERGAEATSTDATEVDRLRAAILDIDAHATPVGHDADGFVAGGYVVSVGAIHRALGVVGHKAAPCAACDRNTHDCLAPRPAPVTGKGAPGLNQRLDEWLAGFPDDAGQGGEPTSGTDDFGRVLIPADDDRRRQLGEAAGLTPEEQSALDAFAFREAEKRQRGVLTTAEAEGGEPTTPRSFRCFYCDTVYSGARCSGCHPAPAPAAPDPETAP